MIIWYDFFKGLFYIVDNTQRTSKEDRVNNVISQTYKHAHIFQGANFIFNKGITARLSCLLVTSLSVNKISLNYYTTSDNGEYKKDYYKRYQELVQKNWKRVEGNEVEEEITEVGERDSRLTHVDSRGRAQMVDVGKKNDTERTAKAVGYISLGETAFNLVKENKIKKGDVLTVAQIAGTMAAKNTSNIIPLCHNIPLTGIDVSLELNEMDWSVMIRSEVRTVGKTGVEMEALTAVSVAALVVYDMCKAVTHDMVISDVKLVEKRGGQRGDYTRK